VSFLVLVGSQNVFAGTEIVFEEDFDGILVGWSESVCNRNDLIGQTCILGQATGLFDVNEPPPSLPNWGFVEIEDLVSNDGGFLPIEVRYQKSFNVPSEDDYNVSAWLGIKDCFGCNISTQLYIDGVLVLERVGPNLPNNTPNPPPHDFFEESTVHLTSGSHDIEMAMFSNLAFAGNFRASFDDILIQRDVPLQPVVGGTSIPIETTSLLLAGAQTFSWMIPVILSGIGIGLFVVSRKSENS